ncbi:MAG: hypothetical protein PHU42_02560 [Patescibacteria group bacterium]|nr:hypothetical protein [Patescibacteria group bacterium]
MREPIRGEVLGNIGVYYMEKQKGKKKIKAIEIPRHDAPERTLAPIVKFMNKQGIAMDIKKMRAELKRMETEHRNLILPQVA